MISMPPARIFLVVLDQEVPLCNWEHLRECPSSTVEWHDDVRISRRPCGRAASTWLRSRSRDGGVRVDVWPRKNVTCAPQ
jgi:hypothetical protein